MQGALLFGSSLYIRGMRRAIWKYLFFVDVLLEDLLSYRQHKSSPMPSATAQLAGHSSLAGLQR